MLSINVSIPNHELTVYYNEHSMSPLPRRGTNSLTMTVLFAIPILSRKN